MNDLVSYLWFKILKDWHLSDLVQIDLEQLLKIEKQGIEFSSLDYTAPCVWSLQNII